MKLLKSPVVTHWEEHLLYRMLVSTGDWKNPDQTDTIGSKWLKCWFWCSVTGFLQGLCLCMWVCAHVLVATYSERVKLTVSIIFETCGGQRWFHQLAQSVMVQSFYTVPKIIVLMRLFIFISSLRAESLFNRVMTLDLKTDNSSRATLEASMADIKTRDSFPKEMLSYGASEFL